MRAVASVVADIDSASSLHSELLVLSVWEAITSNKLRRANAFCIFLSHLSMCRSTQSHATGHAPPSSSSSLGPPAGSSLLPNDRWLVSQVGIALLKWCERNSEWQSGYVVLHHLHRFGIHYVTLCHPSSPLSPLLPRPPSPCAVALTALNICLQLDKGTGSALEVMRGCDWVRPSNETERDIRTEMLTTLAQRCLDGNLLDDACRCLEAIDVAEVAKKLVHLVTNLHNKLLQSLLDAGKVQLALVVFSSMKKACLQCLPSVFTSLLQVLCDTNQVGVVWVWSTDSRPETSACSD